MIHEMKLDNKYFEKIKSGSKTIEIRLNDDKRQKVKINDEIIFTNRTTEEQIRVKVINLHHFNSFEELYKNFNKVSLGYEENEVAKASDMEKYYSKEEQQKYGVLGIEIKL